MGINAPHLDAASNMSVFCFTGIPKPCLPLLLLQGEVRAKEMEMKKEMKKETTKQLLQLQSQIVERICQHPESADILLKCIAMNYKLIEKTVDQSHGWQDENDEEEYNTDDSSVVTVDRY